MDAYEKFQKKLDSLPISTPSTESKVEIEIFKMLMSPEEAEIASQLSGQPENVNTIASRVGIEPEKLAPILDDLAQRGIIFKVVVTPEPMYCLVSVLPGIWEFQLYRHSPELIKLFEKYYEEKLGKAVYQTPTPWMRVVPVKESIPSDTTILTFEEVEKLIDESPTVCLTDCVCRTHHHEIGEGCSYPVKDMCIFLSPWAEFYIATGRGRKATHEEAHNTLKKAEEAGLIHTTVNAQKGVIAVCNCCSCCCLILRGITKLKLPTVIAKSNFIAELSEEECTGCGICVERCHLGALELNDSVVALQKDRCVGCGLCVTTCPTGALELKSRPEPIIPPPDLNTLFANISEERKKKSL